MISYQTNIDKRDYPLVAIDLGYSHKKKSCAIWYEGILEADKILTFGETIERVTSLVDSFGPLVLILEAVLSTYHDKHGNPDIRGKFEAGMGWYYGPAVATYAAALRFLKMLYQRCTTNSIVYLAEAYLSFKNSRSPNSADTLFVFNSFWDTKVENLKEGTEPILNIIQGTPGVRVFNPPVILQSNL
jgi:hypothetical protein